MKNNFANLPKPKEYETAQDWYEHFVPKFEEMKKELEEHITEVCPLCDEKNCKKSSFIKEILGITQ